MTAKNPLVIDLDASLVTSHSEKEFARPTFKKGFGFHPLLAFVDHGTGGSGEMLTCLLRPGNAGSNTAADHKSVIADALAQVGMGSRPGKKVLVRIDGAGGTKKTLRELVKRRVSYSVGFTLPANTPELFRLIPKHVWEPAYNSDGERAGGSGRRRTDRTARSRRRLAGGDARHRPSRATRIPGRSCGSMTSRDTG